jgi:glutamate N-acetyltransferase/amino-acid N-acetyltransferase
VNLFRNNKKGVGYIDVIAVSPILGFIHLDLKLTNSAHVDGDGGRACARNNLLKAAIFGGDPNWGRVLAAVGTADAQMDPLAIDVSLNGVQVCTNSAPDADKSTVNFEARLVEILIDLKIGIHSATIKTNDLSHDYVHENSAYST